MNLLQLADSIAAEAHAGQVDKVGVDYVEHPRAVAKALAMAGWRPEVVATALLHDVLEDSSLTTADLLERGIPAEVVTAVVALTHQPNEPRDVYYARVRLNEWALPVKKADVTHNARRLDLIEDDETRERLAKKYAHATRQLDALS